MTLLRPNNINKTWMMKIILLIIVLMGIIGCTRDAVISGEKYNYKIDKKYLKSNPTSLFGNPPPGDSAAVIAVKYPMKHKTGGLSTDLTILMFHDKIYDKETNLYPFANFKIVDALLVSTTENIYRYEKEATKKGADKDIYYSSFDPNDKATLNRAAIDYFATVTKLSLIHI